MLVSLPVLVIAVNLVFGIYSKNAFAPARKKGVVLLAAVSVCGLVSVLLRADSAAIVLWNSARASIARFTTASSRPFLHAQSSAYFNCCESSRPRSYHWGSRIHRLAYCRFALSQKGERVLVFDRLMYGRDPLSEFIGRPNFRLIEGDATDIAKLTEAMNGASAVVHLAGLVGDPACAVDQTFTRHTNIIATRMARDVAQAMGIQRFVFASSCSVYGVSEREVRETDTLNPVSLYAQTKIDSEREALPGLRDNFFVTILRFATVFGDSRRPRFDLVGNLFTAQAMTDGLITVIGPDQFRPFIHVRDLARSIAMVLAADTDQMQNQIFNVGVTYDDNPAISGQGS